MATSYIERLIWKFFKDRVFGGFWVFLHIYIAPFVLIICVALMFNILTSKATILIVGMSIGLISIGLIFHDRIISSREGALLLLSIVLLSFLLSRVPQHLLLYMLQATTPIIMFSWFIFNSVVFIIHLCDFFASTGGLYLLVGSDEDRVFLHPLPVVLLLPYSIAVFLFLHDIRILILMSTPYLTIILIFTVARGLKRVIRSSLSIYSLVAMYPLISYLTYTRGSINIYFWAAISIISTLFVVQSHARKVVMSDKKNRPTCLVYALLGILLYIAYLLISPTRPLEPIELYDLWWLLSLTSMLLAPILALSIIRLCGKMEYYISRSKVGLPQLFRETLIILGKKLKDEVGKYFMEGLFGLFSR